MNDFRNSRDSRPRPVYRDRRSQPGRPRTAPKKNLFANKAPEGSEQWLKPWVELKYFTYNPAVFPRMLGSVSGEIAPGSLVNVYDKNGELFGAGFWNEASRTPLRMVHHGKDAFAERDLDAALERAVKLRREVLRLDETTNAYRVLHGDSDGLGGLVVDRYADVLSLEVSTLAVWQRLNRWLPLLHRLCGTKRHVVQVDEGIARMEGIRAEEAPESPAPVRLVKIVENGITYEVDFAQGHKTGFFLVYPTDQLPDGLFVETHIGDGGEQALDHQPPCIWRCQRIAISGACQTNECASQLVLEFRHLSGFSADTGFSGTTGAACRLLTLKTKHPVIHCRSSPSAF